MIWIVVAAIALLLVFGWALMRTAALADRMAERWAAQHPSPLDDAHVRVIPGPYDHEARGDFDA